MNNLSKFKGWDDKMLDPTKPLLPVYCRNEAERSLRLAAPDLLAEVVRVRVLYTNIYDCCSKYDEVKAVHKILKLIGAELKDSNDK